MREGHILSARVRVLQESLDNVQTQREELALKLERKVRELAALESTSSALRESLEAEINSGAVQIGESAAGIHVNLSNGILFPTGSAQLDDVGREVLLKVSRELARTDNRIIVEGHTDDVPIRGALGELYPSNWELAAARSARVVRLFEQAGIDGGRLEVISHGEMRPVAPNDADANRALNRRIEIRLIPLE
jgi:chemotaxis protein MotB